MKVMKMKKNPNLFRQGDVILQRLPDGTSLPVDAAKQKRSSRITLALGEVTGHHHTLELEDPADWWKKGEGVSHEQFVDLKKGGTLTHQEHAPIDLPPGKYRVRIQREYSPQEIRSVAD